MNYQSLLDIVRDILNKTKKYSINLVFIMQVKQKNVIIKERV